MPMTGAELLERAATVLQDQAHVRWPLPELGNWLNDGLRAVVTVKPAASSRSVPLQLAEGTLQSLADPKHLKLLRLPRNLQQADTRIGGRAIRPVTRETLDASEPYWHDRAAVPFRKEVRQYVFDEAAPREFYVYPGNDGNGVVEAVVSVLPALITAAGEPDTLGSWATAIDLPEPYPVVLLDYVLHRAFSKDDIAGDAGRAQLHLQAFMGALGVKAQVAATHSPNSRARIAST